MAMTLDAAKELVARWTKEQVASNPTMTQSDIENYAVCIAAKIKMKNAKAVSALYDFAVSLKETQP